jgi:hypothetical protein
MDMSAYQQAIKNIESSGGKYGLVGPRTRSGDRAYGAYQVMGNNIPEWTAKHYGTSLTPTQFLQNKDAQDAVFNGEFGAYLKKQGNPQDAAAMWFSGRPLSQSANSSDGYINTRQYVDKFNQGLGQPGALAYAGTPGAAAAAGGGTGAAGDGDAEDAALGPGKGVLSPGGGWKSIADSEGDNKLSSIGALMAQAGSALAGISNPQQGQVLGTLAKQITENSKPTYKYMMGADGTLYRMDDSGGLSAIKTGSAKPSLQQAERVLPDGTKVPGTFNTQTGQYSWDGGSTQQQSSQPTTIEDLQAIDPARAAAAKAVFDGRIKLPGGSRMTAPQALLRRDVMSVYPGVDESTFTGRNTWTKNFATDQPSQPGGQAVGLGHSREILADLAENMLAQGNYGGGFGVGHAINSIKNMSAEDSPLTRTGADLTDKLVTETGRLYSGNQGGGVHERERTAERFGGDAQSLTPKEQAALLREQRTLIDQRQGQVEDQRDLLFGKEDGAKRFDLTGDRGRAANARLEAVLAKLDPTGAEARRLGGAGAAPAPSGGGGTPHVSMDAIDAEIARRKKLK